MTPTDEVVETVVETPTFKITAPADPHWERTTRKTIYLLNVNVSGQPEGFQPRIRKLTYPLIMNWARKIGAEIVEMTTRQFPDWPITYEKLQIYNIAKKIGSEWNIYVDLDTLINPEFWDPTVMLAKDTVCHNGRDMANVRWKYDQYFRRDGRHWGSCNWFTIASDWCLDIWRPLDDLTPVQAFQNINITTDEHNSAECKTEHLIDDYTLSRNIARFGLKATTLVEIGKTLGFKNPDGSGYNAYLWHVYTHPEEYKLESMLKILSTPNRMMIPHPTQPNSFLGMGWGLMTSEKANELREEFGLRRQ